MSFKAFLLEVQEITSSDLSRVERYADSLFRALNVDVEFSKHFVQRVNDPRNKRPINVAELLRLFNLQYQKNGLKIAKMTPNAERVLKDMATDINSPVVFKWNPQRRMIEMVAKTIMRKKDFKSPDPVLAVR